MHIKSIYVFGLQFRRIYCYPAVEDKVRKVPWWQFKLHKSYTELEQPQSKQIHFADQGNSLVYFTYSANKRGRPSAASHAQVNFNRLPIKY